MLGLVPAQTHVDETSDRGMVEYAIGPSRLAIGCGAPMFKPGGGTNVVSAVEVEDFGPVIARLRERGVRFTMDPNEIPVCFMALIADLDGNPLMIHRRKHG
ncbi:MAG: VOC family protein [Opitutaceae bacterium]